MSQLFRLASPEDYEYIEELNLWELSFDKRPVQGVRCEDPVIGAEKYNQGREKFKALASRHKKHWKPNGLTFSELIRWAIECGTPEQCQLVLALYHCTNDDDYQAMGIQLSRSIDNANVSPIIFFTGKNQRLLGDISMLKQLEEKYHKKGLEFMERLYEGLSEEEIATTLKSMTKIESNLISIREG